MSIKTLKELKEATEANVQNADLLNALGTTEIKLDLFTELTENMRALNAETQLDRRFGMTNPNSMRKFKLGEGGLTNKTLDEIGSKLDNEYVAVQVMVSVDEEGNPTIPQNHLDYLNGLNNTFLEDVIKYSVANPVAARKSSGNSAPKNPVHDTYVSLNRIFDSMLKAGVAASAVGTAVPTTAYEGVDKITITSVVEGEVVVGQKDEKDVVKKYSTFETDHEEFNEYVIETVEKNAVVKYEAAMKAQEARAAKKAAESESDSEEVIEDPVEEA